MNIRDYGAFWESGDLAQLRECIAGSRPWEDLTAHAVVEWREWILTKGIQLPPRPVILEWGCGVGRLLQSCPVPGAQMVGVDISASMLSAAAAARVPATLISSSGASVALAPRSIDMIYSFLVLQHVPTRALISSIISEWIRVLRPGGYIRAQTLCATPHSEEVFGGYHGATFRTLPEFVRAFSDHGLSVVETHLGGFADSELREVPADASVDPSGNVWLWVTAKV
jgi:ubiquinone/menaquinone biosynthesis C-methylase UbiE